jgi:SAM-dependent methyltransferase
VIRPADTERFQTFRDPAGSLYIENGRVLRTIRHQYVDVISSFLRSEVCERWIASRRLVSTEVISRQEDGSVLLEHKRVSFPSYPWEWTPAQWGAAAELTLDLCEELLGLGLILKDATPLNILFEGPQPIFVDVSSVEKNDPTNPIWLAYAQFVRTFLLPLAAYKYLGWPLIASFHKRDGYEPADLYPYLSTLQRWTNPLRSLVTVPCLLEKRKNILDKALTSRWQRSPDVASAILKRNVHTLQKILQSLIPQGVRSRWSEYPEDADHYNQEDHAAKKEFVQKSLRIATPDTVLDLGANTGVYSRIAADQNARVVAWDSDVSACQHNWRTAKREALPIQVLVADVARPTPAAGWRNSESLSLLDRARAQFDCVLMLGLIHHLLLSDQIPLEEVAKLTKDLTRRWLIIEWVPNSDPRFIEILRGRDSLYSHLNEEMFLDSFRNYFSCILREPLKNGRVLFLFEAIQMPA